MASLLIHKSQYDGKPSPTLVANADATAIYRTLSLLSYRDLIACMRLRTGEPLDSEVDEVQAIVLVKRMCTTLN